jgi:hypothetical protein
MSCRNLFVINAKNTKNSHTTYRKLNQYIIDHDFSILFEPKGYWDEILSVFNCNDYYFAVTEDKGIMECDEIFSIVDSFDYAVQFPKKQFKEKEYEFLVAKLSFLNRIVEIVFSDENVESVEFYLSDQYSIDVSDFDYLINVTDKNLTEALIKTYQPSKKANYFGIKTAVFSITR